MQNPNRQSCERKHGTKWNNKAKWQRTTCQRERERPREPESVTASGENMYSPSVGDTHASARYFYALLSPTRRTVDLKAPHKKDKINEY